jgi:hypothetical protein
VYVSREPALVLALIATAVQLVSAFFIPLTDVQQGSINAAAAAIAGIATAIWVTHEKLAPAVLGLVQAGLDLGLSFGLHWTPIQQSVVMSFAIALVAMFVRTQVTAPMPAVWTATD